MKRSLCIGLTALFSVSMLAACGSDDDNSAADVQDANAAFCQDLSAYVSSLTAFALTNACCMATDVRWSSKELRATV